MEDKYQVMPPLTDEEYAELKADIAERGVMVPIEFDEHWNVLDGYHRYRICQELDLLDNNGRPKNGVPYVIRAGLSEDEKFTHARKLNMARRHLTPEQKRKLIQDQIQQTPEKTDIEIASDLDTSPTTVGSVREEMYNSGAISNLENAPSKYKQRAILDELSEHPEKTNREIAQEIGVAHTTVGRQRNKMVSAFNASGRDVQALNDPDIRERMATDESLNVAGAIREQKRDQLVQHLESVETQEAKAVEGVYDVIVIDPPWPMERIESDARPHAVAMDYPVMDVEEIKAMDIPVADDCHIFLWTTQKYLPTAFDVLRAWGFKYVCTFVWHKDNGYKPFGLPKYNCEFCLYAHNGSPKFIDETQFWTCFDAPITGHSEKPDVFYDMIRHVTAGRRLDMFNRRQIDGFDVWGNEAENE